MEFSKAMPTILLYLLLITSIAVTRGCYLVNKNVECISNGDSRKMCQVGNTRMWTKVWVVEQYTESPCIRDKTFGRGDNHVWTMNKCQGRFQLISCKHHVEQKCRSALHSYTLCKIPGAFQVTFARIITTGSYAPCTPDQYGINGDSVWVSEGCNGLFDVCYETLNGLAVTN